MPVYIDIASVSGTDPARFWLYVNQLQLVAGKYIWSVVDLLDGQVSSRN